MENLRLREPNFSIRGNSEISSVLRVWRGGKDSERRCMRLIHMAMDRHKRKMAEKGLLCRNDQ